MAEMITEVDENDNVIGIRNREEFYTGKYIHRSVSLMLFNSKHELLIQKRTMSKRWYPGLWILSVSGTVSVGESYEQCMIKETKEEIGLDVKPKAIFKHRSNHDNDNTWYTIFMAKSDKPLTLEKSEIDEIRWISIKDLKEDIARNPNKYTYPFIQIMKKYFSDYYKK